MGYSDKLLLLREEIQHLQAAQQHLVFSLGRTKDRINCNPETLTPEELERFHAGAWGRATSSLQGLV